jgi:hypothetical protein
MRFEIRRLFAGFQKEGLLAGTGKNQMDFNVTAPRQPLQEAERVDCAARSGNPYDDSQNASSFPILFRFQNKPPRAWLY